MNGPPELCFSGMSVADPHQHAPWLLMNRSSELKRDTRSLIRQNVPPFSLDTSFFFSVSLWDVYINNIAQLGFIPKGASGKYINYIVDTYKHLLFGLLSLSFSTSLYSCSVKKSPVSFFSSSWILYMPQTGKKMKKYAIV